MRKLYGIISFIVLWYLLVSITRNIIPFPHLVLENFMNLLFKGLNQHIYASVRRLLIGLSIAVILGVHTGILLGLSKKSEELFLPIIYVIYPIPKAALLPVLIILYGIGDLTKILLIILIVIFPIIINIKDAVRAIPNEIFYVAKTLSLDKRRMYKDIIIPAILPNLLTSLRIGVGISVAVLYLSENFATFKGLGYYITINMSNNLNMFTGIFALSLIGYCLFLFIDLLEILLCKWV